MIVPKNPQVVMNEIETVFGVKDSSKGAPNYYLGNDYKCDKKDRWCIRYQRYLKEVIKRVEVLRCEIQKSIKPMETNDHPEIYVSNVLNEDMHRKYQMLIGLLNWLVTIGIIDISYAV